MVTFTKRYPNQRQAHPAAEKIRELSDRMKQLSIQPNAPLDILHNIYGRGRYTTLVHLITNHHALCGWHLMQLVYWRLKGRGGENLYYKETKALVDAGWLCRERLTERRDDVFYLGEWGRMLAKLNGRKASDRRILRSHDLLTADFMTECLRRTRNIGGEGRWDSEWEARLTDYLRPDALIHIERDDGILVGCIEADTGSEHISTFASKYDNYLDYYKRGDWRERFKRDSFPIILTITKGGWDRLAGMRAALRERMRETATRLLFFLTTEQELARLIETEHSAGPVHEPIWYVPDEEGSRAIWQL